MAFSRRQLLEHVWGGDWYGDDHVIDVHVGNLRRKLGDDAAAARATSAPCAASATGWVPADARPSAGPPAGWRARLFAAQALIVVAGALTLVSSPLLVAPGLFRDHLHRAMGSVSSHAGPRTWTRRWPRALLRLAGDRGRPPPC